MGTGMITTIWDLAASCQPETQPVLKPRSPTPRSAIPRTTPALVRDIWSLANLDMRHDPEETEAALNQIKNKFEGRVYSPLDTVKPRLDLLSPEEFAAELEKERQIESREAARKVRDNIVDDEICALLMNRLDHMPTPIHQSRQQNPFNASTCRVPGYVFQKFFRIAHERTRVSFAPLYKMLPQSIKDESRPSTLLGIIAGNQGHRGDCGVPFRLMQCFWDYFAKIPDWKQPVAVGEYFQPLLFDGQVEITMCRDTAKSQVNEALRSSNTNPEKFRQNMVDQGLSKNSLKKIMTSAALDNSLRDSIDRRHVAYMLAVLQPGADLPPFKP